MILYSISDILLCEFERDRKYCKFGQYSLKEYYLKLIEVFLNHIDGQEDVYKSILINNRNSIIMDMMYNTIAEDIRTRVKNNELNVPEEIFISYYLGAIVNVGIDWLKSNKKYSKEEMLEYLDKLMN